MHRPDSLRPLGAWAALLVLFGLLFWLPYHVPLAPSVSDSYIAGYNNRAGTVLVFLGALIAGCFLREPRELAGEPRSGKPLQRSTLLKAAAGLFLLSLALFFYTSRLDGFSESVYSVDRVRLMLAGQRPYRDFEYAYGPLLLYGPYALLKVLPLSVPDACGLLWLALTVLGVVQLYLVLRWTEFSQARQRPVFLLLFLSSVFPAICTSSSYALSRFLTPLFCAMVMQRALSGAETPASRAKAMLLLVPCSAAVLALSPEMGLAFTAILLLYALRYWRRAEPVYLAALLATAALLGMFFLVAEKNGVFSTLRGFSAGGMNFPLIPGPYLLTFLAAIGITAIYMGSRLRARQDTPLLASSFVAMGLLPAALGRSDPAHMLLDGMGVYLCALLVCVAAGRGYRLLVLATVLLYLGVPLLFGTRSIVSLYSDPALTYLLHSGDPRKAHWAEVLSVRLHGAVKGEQRIAGAEAVRTLHQSDDISATFHVPPSTVFAAPFAFFGGHTGPYHSPQIDEGYYLGMVNLVSPDGVTRKITELAAHPERPLLLSPGAAFSCSSPASSAQAEIRSLTLYPYRLHPMHRGDVLEPLCAYIRDNYDMQEAADAAHFNYAVWVRHPAALPH